MNQQVGILELLNDPFARTRVVSKKGKINTHRESYNRDFKVWVSPIQDYSASNLHICSITSRGWDDTPWQLLPNLLDSNEKCNLLMYVRSTDGIFFCPLICYRTITTRTQLYNEFPFRKLLMEFFLSQDFERSVHLVDPPLMVVDYFQLLCIIRLLVGVLCRHLVSYRSDSRWVNANCLLSGILLSWLLAESPDKYLLSHAMSQRAASEIIETSKVLSPWVMSTQWLMHTPVTFKPLLKCRFLEYGRPLKTHFSSLVKSQLIQFLCQESPCHCINLIRSPGPSLSRILNWVKSRTATVRIPLSVSWTCKEPDILKERKFTKLL